MQFHPTQLGLLLPVHRRNKAHLGWVSRQGHCVQTSKSTMPSTTTASTARFTFSRKSAEGIQNQVEREQKDEEYGLVHDLKDLRELNIENVLTCLSSRYSQGLYYTLAGPVLISLNPSSCNQDEGYSSRKSLGDFVQSQNNGAGDSMGMDRPPHVYTIGSQSLRALLATGLDQVVIVSGESGAGKTTATQQLLGYFIDQNKEAQAVVAETTDLDKKILFTTAILESLGNASTPANPNSSRFGRFLQLHYKSGRIVGGRVRTCLLEKHRVGGGKAGLDRNFHIFYYTLTAIQKHHVILDLTLFPPFLGSSPSHAATFPAIYDSLKSAGLDELVFPTVAGLMLLLNFRFVPDHHHQFRPENKKVLEAAGRVLGLETDELWAVLVSSTIRVGGRRASVYRQPCTSILQCQQRLSSLTSYIYEFLFSRVLTRLNAALNPQEDCSTLSLLDLYGFENLASNHLEQLCINYANERVQGVYLAKVKEDLDEETIQLDRIQAESRERLEGIQTVWVVLNEACLLNRSSCTEEEHFQRLAHLVKGTDYVESGTNTTFIIRHYAADVVYQFKGMIGKNSDIIPAEFEDLLASSTLPFIRSLIIETPRTTPRRTSRPRTILHRFKSSVDELIQELSSESVSFIRCIRPSQELGGRFQEDLVKAQLYSTGLVDLVKVQGGWWPVRIPKSTLTRSFHATMSRYGPALLTRLSSAGEVKSVGSKYLFTQRAWTKLKRLEGYLLAESARKIQRAWRKWKRGQGLELISSSSSRRVPLAAEEALVKQVPRVESLNLHQGDRVTSRGEVYKTPVRFHTRPTALSYSYKVPKGRVGLNVVLDLV